MVVVVVTGEVVVERIGIAKGIRIKIEVVRRLEELYYNGRSVLERPGIEVVKAVETEVVDRYLTSYSYSFLLLSGSNYPNML